MGLSFCLFPRFWFLLDEIWSTKCNWISYLFFVYKDTHKFLPNALYDVKLVVSFCLLQHRTLTLYPSLPFEERTTTTTSRTLRESCTCIKLAFLPWHKSNNPFSIPLEPVMRSRREPWQPGTPCRPVCQSSSSSSSSSSKRRTRIPPSTSMCYQQRCTTRSNNSSGTFNRPSTKRIITLTQ